MSHPKFNRPAIVAATFALLLGACSELTDGGANEPLPEPEDQADATVPDSSGISELNISIEGDCYVVPLEDVMRVRETLEPHGHLSALAIAASQGDLACSEPIGQESVDCELKESGLLVLEQARNLIGLKTIAGPVAARISAETVVCTRL